jgi:hypothetical protein
MWAVQSIQFGYKCSVGGGDKIRFWEDTWFGTSLCCSFFLKSTLFAMSRVKPLNKFRMDPNLRFLLGGILIPHLCNFGMSLRQ